MNGMQNSNKKGVLVAIAMVVILTGLIMIFSRPERVESPSLSEDDLSVPQEKSPDADNPDIRSYRATLTGAYECLPHKNQNGPQTMECAFGIKLDDGSHYALDFNFASQTPPNIEMGTRVSASGLVTPIEMLSSTHLRDTYNVKGILSVENIK